LGNPEALHFDLVERDWIPVRLLDGRQVEVGIGEVLRRAHEIVGLDVGFPTQEPPILRLLLAVLYRALEGPTNDASWSALWSAEELPKEPIDAYLERWRHRFDLLDSKAPFFQVADLEATSGEGGERPAGNLISYAATGNNVPLFMPVVEAMGIRLSAPEAARWVLERHAWGTTADRGGARGNPLVNAGGKDVPPIGHLGWIGFTAPLGATLRETLLLNLIPWSHSGLILTGPYDLPAWERAPVSASHEKRPPTGVCDLYTWQGRRIRLFAEQGADGEPAITGVLICAGDAVLRDAVQGVEPQTAWRRQTSPGKSIEYTPLHHQPARQVWRGLAPMLSLDEPKLRAGVLSWLGTLEDEGTLDVSTTVSLLIVGLKYGQQSALVEDLITDRLETPVALLRANDPSAAQVAIDGVALAAEAARQLGKITNIAFMGPDAKVPREGPKAESAKAAQLIVAEDLYGTLDAPFRKLLMDLGGAHDPDTLRPSWATEVRLHTEAAAQRLMSAIPTQQVFVGAQAERWFRAGLHKALQQMSPNEEEQ
jgi:CRISPR system Cascade subunit CasA